uniref:Uncharacterized protein n=1 Tax=Cacopsylla melanoneura TaxID=428564 RepID=A0A8D8LAW7_9HEMI
MVHIRFKRCYCQEKGFDRTFQNSGHGRRSVRDRQGVFLSHWSVRRTNASVGWGEPGAFIPRMAMWRKRRDRSLLPCCSFVSQSFPLHVSWGSIGSVVWKSRPRSSRVDG